MKLIKSRSHKYGFAEKFAKECGIEQIVSMQSSMKACTLANGKVDVYIRTLDFAEWDICAGDAIIREAGGILADFDGNVRKYNSENIIIHNVIASNNKIHKKLVKMLAECEKQADNNRSI